MLYVLIAGNTTKRVLDRISFSFDATKEQQAVEMRCAAKNIHSLKKDYFKT